MFPLPIINSAIPYLLCVILVNTIMPERSVKVHATDRPWITDQLKRLFAKRQKAFTSGSKSLYAVLRNNVIRERKRCRKTYYSNKVRHLQDTKPRDWWREVKQLCEMVGFLVRIFVQFLMKTLAIATKN